MPTDNELAEALAFRVGRKVPRNIYRGDEPVCMVATAEAAEELVTLLNLGAAALRARPEARAGDGTGSFQARVRAYMARLCENDATDLAERRDRFGEEALELQQSLGTTREDAHALVDYVFGRPVGDPTKEMGGVEVTLAALATFAGIDKAACGESELDRIDAPAMIAKIAAKRATRHGRGALPGLSVLTAQPNTEGRDAGPSAGGRDA